MNNLLPYYGLGDAKIRASDKDLPVCVTSCKNVSMRTFTEKQIFALFFCIQNM
jgi:hypothetical protein